MEEQTPGKVLKHFSMKGWPQTKEEMVELLMPFSKMYGGSNIGASLYPDLGPATSMDGKTAYYSPIHGWSTNPAHFPKLGTRWTAEFPNGQTLSLVITNDGELIERSYSDKGDIHTNEIYRFLRGLQKTIEQTHPGGRPSDPDIDSYFEIWAKSGFDTKIKQQLRKLYLDIFPDDLEAKGRFNDGMRYRKRKYLKNRQNC